MKPTKHFVKITRIDLSGRVIQNVVMTPPMDTAEQAQAHADWLKQAVTVQMCVEEKMLSSLIFKERTSFVTVVFETTLY